MTLMARAWGACWQVSEGVDGQDERSRAAQGLGVAPQQLSPPPLHAHGGEEAFFCLDLPEGVLAISAHCTLALFRARSVDCPRKTVGDVLARHGIPATRWIMPDTPAASDTWVEVALGERGASVGEGLLTASPPGEEGVVLHPSDLRRWGRELQAAATENELRLELLTDCAAPLVFPTEVVARVTPVDHDTPATDVFGRPLPATAARPFPSDQGLRLEEGTVRAQRPGYLVMRGHDLALWSPVWIRADGMGARFLLQAQTRPLSEEQVLECLREAGVTSGIVAAGVTRVAESSTAGPRPSAETVARHRPVGSRVLELAVEDVGHPSGPPVQRGEVVAYRDLAGDGEGLDVFGRPVLPPDPSPDQAVAAGRNLRRGLARDRELWLATTDGVAVVRQNRLHVQRCLSLKPGVEDLPATIDYEGTIHIQGSLHRRVSLTASGDIVVEGSTANAVHLKAGMDVRVSGGIAGRKTVVEAGGSVWADSIDDAHIVAGEDIHASGDVRNATAIAGRDIVVTENGQPLSTAGRFFAGRRVLLPRVLETQEGSLLCVGIEPSHWERISQLREKAEASYEQTRLVLQRLGLSAGDIPVLVERLRAYSGPRRRQLVHAARTLLDRAATCRHIRRILEETLRGLTVDDGCEILLSRGIEAGVEVCLGPHRHRLDRPRDFLHWRTQDQQLSDASTAEPETGPKWPSPPMENRE